MCLLNCLLYRPLKEEGEKEGEEEVGALQSTGHLGDVMKESTEIAYTFAKVKLSQHTLRFFLHTQLAGFR